MKPVEEEKANAELRRLFERENRVQKRLEEAGKRLIAAPEKEREEELLRWYIEWRYQKGWWWRFRNRIPMEVATYDWMIYVYQLSHGLPLSAMAREERLYVEKCLLMGGW